MKPALRRSAVRYLEDQWQLSERRASGLASVCRATVRYQAQGPEDESVRQRLRELAALRKRFGYRRLYVLLRREGVLVNHKRGLPAVPGGRAVAAPAQAQTADQRRPRSRRSGERRQPGLEPRLRQ